MLSTAKMTTHSHSSLVIGKITITVITTTVVNNRETTDILYQKKLAVETVRHLRKDALEVHYGLHQKGPSHAGLEYIDS